MDCRTTTAHKFRTRLKFKKYHFILTKEQSVLARIMSSFEGENMETQYNALGHKIDLYFYYYKLAIKIGKNGHSDRYIYYEIKRQKAIEQELGRKFIRIDPDKRDFDFFRAMMKHLDSLNNQLKKFNK